MYDVSGLNPLSSEVGLVERRIMLLHLIMGLSPKRRTLQSSVRSAINITVFLLLSFNIVQHAYKKFVCVYQASR